MAGRRRRWRGVVSGIACAGVVLFIAPAPAVASAPVSDIGASSTGTITLVQDAQPDGSQDFSFTGCSSGGCGVPFSLDDDTDPTLPATVSGTDIGPGSYSITQAAAANWSLTSIACDGGQVVDLGARRVDITLGAGQHVTCTFTNRTQGITLVQDTLPDGPQDFAYTGCLGDNPNACSAFSLDDDADPTLPRQVQGFQLPPGVYTMTQLAAPGWDLVSLTCTTGETVDLPSRDVTITLEPGEQTTCTFSNRSPSITVVYDRVPDSGQDVVFSGCNESACVPFSLDDDADPTLPAQVSAAGVANGVYTITQAPVAGQDVSIITCTTGESPDVSARRITITLTAGEQTVCTFSNAPVAGPWRLVAAAPTHTCARVYDNTVRCWGTNGGALGDGTAVDRTLPTTVLDPTGSAPLDEVAEVRAGGVGTCAKLIDGQVRCWGTLTGDGTALTRLLPVAVRNPEQSGPLTGVTQLGVGGDHSCSILASTEAFCWGLDTFGQLGMGGGGGPTGSSKVRATDGPGTLTGASRISSGGSHTCVRMTDFGARCWGRNASGQLGDGTTTDRNRPVVVVDPEGDAPMTDVAQVVAGTNTSCLRTLDLRAYCWGGLANSSTPIEMPDLDGIGPLTGVLDLSVGLDHVCAVLSGGGVVCAGGNGTGQIGDTTTTTRLLPVAVAGVGGSGALTGVSRVSAAGAPVSPGQLQGHTCAALLTGDLRCWGHNDDGLLGDGTTAQRTSPVAVLGPG